MVTRPCRGGRWSPPWRSTTPGWTTWSRAPHKSTVESQVTTEFFLNENFKLVCCCCNSGELDFYIQPNIRHNNDVGVWPWNERKRDLSHSEVWQEFEEKRFKFEVSGEHGFSVSGTVAKVISYDISKIFKDPTRSNKFLGSDWSNQSFCSFHGFCVPPVPQLPWGWGCSPTINTPSRWAAIDAYWPGPLGFLLYWSWIPWCPNIQ